MCGLNTASSATAVLLAANADYVLLKKTNRRPTVEHVQMIVRVVNEVGLEHVTPSETRQMLMLKGQCVATLSVAVAPIGERVAKRKTQGLTAAE